ncbi:GDNF family receptor alpha-1, partial [Dufourea novaeangliae]
DIKVPVAILNCLYARQLCFEDPSCSAILEIIPRVCGPEIVACSTVTVTKCQAALHTLQAFPFFRPTCLCREPNVDPDCNSFQNFLFDHPCIYVLKKEFLPSSTSVDLSGTDSALYPFDPQQESYQELWLPPTSMYPYFLFPGAARTSYYDHESTYDVQEPGGQRRQHGHRHQHGRHQEAPELPGRPGVLVIEGYDPRADHEDRQEARAGAENEHRPVYREKDTDDLKVISHSDNSTSFELIESQVENPLIDAGHQDLLAMKEIPIPGGTHHKTHHKKNQTDDHDQTSVVLPSASSDLDKIQQPVKVILSSTCHHAYTACKNDPDCKVLLEPVLNHCDLTSCARNECMDALQNFYKSANHKHSVEIAFCLCRKTDGKKDECMVAQEKMHPACAQRVEGSLEMPTCHSLAEACKENRGCRMKLEYYEQSCAVDSVTKKCAGPPAECRKAMLGILGTELRYNCACKGPDLTQIYDCLGWQRLLWVNPCVVESQKDYHARRKHHHYPRTTTTTVLSTTRSPVSVTTATAVVEQVEDNQIPEVTKWSTTEPTETWEITTTTTSTTTTTTTTTSTTPSTTTTTTTPPRFCVVQRLRQSHQYIREGKGKRLYRDDEPECSELCQCSEGEVLICNTICVDSSPCQTDFAFYNHEAPAYQAHRGPCLCYSGRFICMRPLPDAYSIPHGVFMFLGYSEKDESLLRQHNNVTVLDAISSLDNFMREEVNNQTVCTLFLYNATRENVIAVARLGTDNPPLNSSQAQSLQQLLRVKEECASMLQDLSDKINNKHHDVHTHPLLSIFKMAEVEVKLPYSNEVGGLSRSSSALLVAILLLLSLLRSTTSTCLVAS